MYGVGAKCVNAVSEWFKVEVTRDAKIHAMSFERGATKQKLHVRVGQGEVDYGKLIQQLAKVGYDRALSVHMTPIEGFDVAGRDAAEVNGRDEQAVLDTLADPSREHAFCVVQGEPGSGKSHLIRWLSVNWPQG